MYCLLPQQNQSPKSSSANYVNANVTVSDSQYVNSNIQISSDSAAPKEKAKASNKVFKGVPVN